MNAIGPVEPGQDTYDREPEARRQGELLRRLGRRLRESAPRTRRLVLAAVAVCAVAAALLVRLAQPPPPPAPPPPWPSRSVSVTYAGAMSRTVSGDRHLTFSVTLANRPPDATPVPPVTVLRITQPSPALSVTASPALPFTVKSGTHRRVVITMNIRECAKAPRNDGLPFLEVTLRNTRAKQDLSFILGSAYAADLSTAITAACPQPAVS